MFKINDVEWNILYVNPNSECLMRSDGTITLGVTDWSKRTVYLSNALSGSLLERVLSHELVHCASFSYDCQIPIDVEISIHAPTRGATAKMHNYPYTYL